MNDEHIKLSDTSVKMINKKINDINYMMKNISNDINTEELSHHMKKCYCSLLESYSKELFSYLDYDSDLAKDLNNRHESLKNANEKIRELETQIGNKIGDLDVIHGVSRISETMKEWWLNEGFCSFENININQAKSIDVTFSLTPETRLFSLFFDTLSPSEVESAIKENAAQKEHMMNKYDISKKGHLIDNDANKLKIINLILNKYPNATLIGFKSKMFGMEDEDFRLANIRFLIHNSNIQLPKRT